jgi:hypothetical protein
MRRFLPLLLLTGCLSYPGAITFQAPRAPSPTEIQSCQKTRNWHNAWVILGAVFGALSGLGGLSSGLLTDSGQKLAVGIAAGSAGAFGTISSALAGLEASTYADNNCQVVLQQSDEAKRH